MDDEIRDYLTELVRQLPTRDAAAALGYSLTSYSSLKSLLDSYGVELPPRKNQYDALEDEDGVEDEIDGIVAVRGVHGRSVALERAVVFGDNHGRHTDPRAFGILLAVIKDIKPERIFINGDFADFEAISRYDKDPRVELELEQEIDNANYLLDRVQEAAGEECEIVMLEGNHEARLRAYLHKNGKSLVYLKNRDGERLLSVENLLHLSDRGIRYIKQEGKSSRIRYGAITIGHFDKYSATPAAVARWFLEHRNESVIQGHTHKRCQLDRRFPDGREITCIEHGHLSNEQPNYVTDPDWAQGFVVITKRKDTDRFHTELVRIVDHECLYNGVLYSG